MISTFHGIELGKRSLQSHQVALNTTGHNIANTNNPDHSRQKVELQSFHPIQPLSLKQSQNEGQIGSGVSVKNIQRIRDEFLDDRIIQQSSTNGFWNQKTLYLKQIESIHNEPNTPNLKTLFEEFISQWNNLANNPSEGGKREALRSYGITLSQSINTRYNQLIQLRKNVNNSIKSKIQNINVYSQKIADYNEEITKIEANGKKPNDLKDRRDALVNKMSKLIPISIGRSDKDEFIIYLQSERLIQGSKYEKLNLNPNRLNEGLTQILWQNGESPQIKSGEIGALLSLRDQDIKTEIKQLNNFALNLTQTVNNIHKDGIGLNGNTNINFFHYSNISPNSSNIDQNGDEIINKTAIYQIHGNNSVDLEETIGSNGTIKLAGYPNGERIIKYQNNDTVKSIINKINNSKANVVAFLNHENKLTLKALDSNNSEKYNIQLLEDSGIFLTQFTGILKDSGPKGSFSSNQSDEIAKLLIQKNHIPSPHKNPASWIRLSNQILQDANNIAASQSKNPLESNQLAPNDGSNALKIVAALSNENENNTINASIQINHQPVILDHNSKSFRSFINNNIEKLGANSFQAELSFKKEQVLSENLLRSKEAISGVSIDEELSSMLRYQHGYSASAKFISYVDRMLDTIINRLGI